MSKIELDNFIALRKKKNIKTKIRVYLFGVVNRFLAYRS
jgi:hypothetical protein